MVEILPRLETPPDFTVPRGTPMPGTFPLLVDGERYTLYDTNSMSAYFSAVANDLSPDEHLYANRLVADFNGVLPIIMDGVRRNYRITWATLMRFESEKYALQNAARRKIRGAEVSSNRWRVARIETGHYQFVLDRAFRDMLPDLIRAGIPPLSITA